MSQVPTVGRLVHFTPSQDTLDAHAAVAKVKDQPYPANITHVFSNGCVNLSVADDGSFPLSGEDKLPTSVNLGTGPRTWCWPPLVITTTKPVLTGTDKDPAQTNPH